MKRTLLAILLAWLQLFPAPIFLAAQQAAEAQQQTSGIVFPPSAPFQVGLTILPANAQVLPGGTVQFSAFAQMSNNSPGTVQTGQCASQGGWQSSTAPVASVNSAGLATGLNFGQTTISCTIGSFTGTATLTVTSSVQITSPFCATPPCALPAGIQNQAYLNGNGFTFTQVGGILPVTWSITAGSFQTGLSLNAGTGVLSGTPSATGTQVVTIKVTDANAASVSLQVSLTVAAAGACTATPPTFYCSSKSTSLDVWPSYPPQGLVGLTGQNNFVTEASPNISTGGWRTLRVSDSTTSAAGSHTASSSTQNQWSCQPVCSVGDGSYFFSGDNALGSPEFFRFVPGGSFGTVTTLASSLVAANGGYTFLNDGREWSFHRPNIFYSVGQQPTVPASYNPQLIAMYQTNLALTSANSWTASTITPTTLLDPTGNTDPCTGLGATQTGEWNQYLWNTPGDVGISVNDGGGAGTGQVMSGYRYQQDNGGLVVLYDGAQLIGQRCSWYNFRTAQFSIHGGAVQSMTGLGTLPAPAAPTVSFVTTGGTLDCTKHYALGITYTILGVGESLLSPQVDVGPTGSGSTCSIVLTNPTSAVSVPGITSLHPTGLNIYECSFTTTNICRLSNNTMKLATINNSAITTLAQPTISNVTCATAGAASYTYYEIAVNSSGMSVPSFAVTVNSCAAKLSGTNSNTVTGTTVANASSYTFCRDFLNACFNNGSSAVFTDTGTNPLEFVVQTAQLTPGPLLANNQIITQIPTSGLPPPTIATSGLNIHNARMRKDGVWITVSSSVSEIRNVLVSIDTTNGTAVTFDNGSGQGAMVSPCGGHWTFDLTHIFCPDNQNAALAVGQFTLSDDPIATQASLLELNSNPALANASDDKHYSYPFATNGNILGISTYLSGGNLNLPVQPQDGEYVGFLTNTTSLPYRFGRNWSSGFGFNATPRGAMSPDGKFVLQSSDWMRNVAGTSACAGAAAPNGCGFGGFSNGATTATCAAAANGTCRTEIILTELK